MAAPAGPPVPRGGRRRGGPGAAELSGAGARGAMADSTLLYSLGPHGPGWRFEQLADASAEAGWVMMQPATVGAAGEPCGSAEASGDAPPSATAAMAWAAAAALRRRDGAALAEKRCESMS